jgi:uncharacterized RDD family membrane protein YckC/ABC-type oligopeptide transport system ATPase subunit
VNVSAQPSNPYVGLRPFFTEDNFYFFGREQQTAELLDILHQYRFLGVVGSSGSGKSSLVRAGLLPALQGGFLVDDRDLWHIVQMKPGDEPIGNLTENLLKAMGEASDTEVSVTLEQRIRDEHTDAVIDFLKPRFKENANLFLLVDQFEEIFAFRGSSEDDRELRLDARARRERARRGAEAADFVDLVMKLAEQRDLPIYVSLTMRTDFLGHCDVFYGFPEALNRGRYLVPRMSRQQLSKAIAGPARLKGARISARLMDYLLNELGDRFDRLPVLQHALSRTWDAWEASGGIGPIDLEHYRSAGGLEGALDQDAEDALKGIDIDLAERVFKRLTNTDLSQRRIRSPARISELVDVTGASTEEVKKIVRRFRKGGRNFVYCSADGKPDDPRIDISHESLIRQWNRLRNWVDEERKARDIFIKLVERARRWKQGEVPLLWPPELDGVVEWKEELRPSPGWAARHARADDDLDCAMNYLNESIDKRCDYLAKAELKRRWNKTWNPLLIVIIAILTLLTVVYIPVEALFEGVKEKWIRKLLDFSVYGIFIFIYLALSAAGQSMLSKFSFEKIFREYLARNARTIEVTKPQPVAEVPGNVEMQSSDYASTFRRMSGFIIDGILLYILLIVCVIPTTFLNIESEDMEMVIFYVIFSLVSWSYSTFQITGRRQATLGMRSVGIFRTDMQGNALSIGRATILWLIRLFTYYLVFIQPFSKHRQTVHDMAAKSVVLRRPKPATGEEY